ncbi:MAG: hypothetical protein ACHQCF_06245 [Solirubrobacterales bacterium]
MLSQFIADSHAEISGLRITAASQGSVLGDRAWYRGSPTAGDGATFTGTDFIEFAPGGQINRVANFFEA